jgi:protein TonB
MAVSARTRWTAAAVSAALNGAVILGVAQIGAGAPARVWVEDPVMNVELVSVLGASVTAQDEPAQAHPPPLEPAPAPSPSPDVPQRPAAETSAAPGPLYLAETPATSAAPTAAAPAAARTVLAAPPQRAGTREGLDIDAPNGASLDYASRLRAWLEAHKTYPRRSRLRREEGVVQIHFAVDRRGRLLGGDVIRSSGHAALDAEAMAMLDRANPFPSAPHGIRGERIEISTPVEFSLAR